MTEPATIACSHRGCLTGARQPLLTVPTYITFARMAASTVVFLLAIRAHSMRLALVGLAVYWVGDILDGWVARTWNQETRTGAVLDILCDRLGCGTFYVIFAFLRPEMTVPVGLYLVEFMVLDCFLSLAFLNWPLVSPNYFHLVDRRVYRLNWSPVAKSCNTGALLVVMLATGSTVLATLLMLAVGVVKVYSLWLVRRIPAGTGGGCAVQAVRRGSAGRGA